MRMRTGTGDALKNKEKGVRMMEAVAREEALHRGDRIGMRTFGTYEPRRVDR